MHELTSCLLCRKPVSDDHDDSLPVYVWVGNGDDELRGYVHDDCWLEYFEPRRCAERKAAAATRAAT